MASFDENGKYIKTNWKAGDKITATKLNKIEESIEAVNGNDISRHVETVARLDALEAKDAAHDKEFINVKNLIEDVEQTVNDTNDTFIAEISGLKAIDEALQNDVSEIQNDVSEIQNDMINAQTQSFTVMDTYKFTVDHDGMMPSLVTFNNIEGLSSVDHNHFNTPLIVSRHINNICTVDTESINYFKDARLESNLNGGQCVIDNTNVRVFGSHDTYYYTSVSLKIPTLETGKLYCLFCDNILVTSGNPGIRIEGCDVYTFNECENGTDINVSGHNLIFRPSYDFLLTLYCGMNTKQGDVTYENIQIYEVKEMVVPYIQLNSLPNGTKDEIKDGVHIKRISDTVRLDSLEWVASGTNTSTSQFRVYYTNSLSDVAWPIPERDGNANPNSILCNMLSCVCQNVALSATQTEPEYMISGITRNLDKPEIRVKVYGSDAPDLAAFKTWLASNNVTMQYELEDPICTDVNTTIKADKGDTVVINTCKPLDLTYDIQLNTRAQIEALQDDLVNLNASISSDLQNIRESIDYNIMNTINGTEQKTSYTLPGGLIIKAGLTLDCKSGEAIRIDYDTPFPTNSVSLVVTMNGGAMTPDSQVGMLVIHDVNGFYLRHEYGQLRQFNYLAIGY